MILTVFSQDFTANPAFSQKIFEKPQPFIWSKLDKIGVLTVCCFLSALSSRVKRLLDKAFGECDHKVCEKCGCKDC